MRLGPLTFIGVWKRTRDVSTRVLDAIAASASSLVKNTATTGARDATNRAYRLVHLPGRSGAPRPLAEQSRVE